MTTPDIADRFERERLRGLSHQQEGGCLERWCIAIDHGSHFQLGPLVERRDALEVTRPNRRIARVLIEKPPSGGSTKEDAP